MKICMQCLGKPYFLWLLHYLLIILYDLNKYWISKDLNKYEYLTGEDLGYKPWVVEEAKFEYYPLGTDFNKGLEKEDKNKGILKRLGNIKDHCPPFLRFPPF